MSNEKLNLRGIIMDMDMVISKYDGKIASCSDSEEIRQISLFCQQNPKDYRNAVLLDMINPKFAFAGLYPHIHKPLKNMRPDNSKTGTKGSVDFMEFYEKSIKNLENTRRRYSKEDMRKFLEFLKAEGIVIEEEDKPQDFEFLFGVWNGDNPNGLL